MSKRVTKEQRHAIVQRYLNGEAVATISRETTIPRSTLYLWIRKARINPSKKVQLRDLSRLKMQYERSQRIAQILQTAPCTASSSLREKLDTIVLMSKYVSKYNSERPHSFLRYMTPSKFEELYHRYHPNEVVQDSSDSAEF